MRRLLSSDFKLCDKIRNFDYKDQEMLVSKLRTFTDDEKFQSEEMYAAHRALRLIVLFVNSIVDDHELLLMGEGYRYIL